MKRDARDTPKSVTLGFEDDCVTLPIDAILPLRALGSPRNPAGSTGRSWHPFDRSGSSSPPSSFGTPTSPQPRCCSTATCGKPKKVKGITPEAMARMEQELARLQEGIAAIQDTYGQDQPHLTVIKGYVGKPFGNARVVRYLMQTRPEFLSGFQTIADMGSVMPAEAE